jgi:hypothetical protein
MPSNLTVNMIWEDQKPSILKIPDATAWIFHAYAFGTVSFQGNATPQDTVLPNLQLFPSIKHEGARSGRNKMSRGNISLNALVLDSGASLHLFANEDMLQNVRADPNPTTIHCGGKSWSNNQIGELCNDLKDLPLPQDDLHLHKDGVANLLSLALLSKSHRIVLDTSIDNAFYVYKDNGEYIRFSLEPNGLYCLHVDDGSSPATLLTTVDEEKKLFSALDVKRAALARYIQDCLCLPSDEDFANGLENGGIKECGVSRRNINIAKAIFGPNKHSVQGKSVQRTNNMPREDQILGVPPSVLEHYSKVTVGIDVMHVNGMPYLINTAKHLKFIQCICIRNKSDAIYVAAIKRMDSIYKLRGFKITTMYADRAFEHCKEELALLGIDLICCDANAHVHFIERCIRFIKERIRGVRSMLPFNKIPKRLMMELIYTIVQLVNAVKRKGGVHPTMSPRQIITGKKLIIPPYVPGALVYGVPGGSTNATGKFRAFDALYLRPNDGGGGHFVYNIGTKQRNSVPRVIGMEGKGIPMTNEIIKTINDQGNDENQPDGIIFGNINNITTILDLEAGDEGEEEPEFDDDNASDRSYLPKDDDSTLSGDHDLPDFHQDNEPQGYHEDEGVDAVNDEDQGVDAEEEPQQMEEDPLLEELNVVEDDDDADEDTDRNGGISDVDEESSAAEEEAPKKKGGLDGEYWNREGEANYCLSIIRGYGNLEATLSTPQYGFKKGLTIFGGPGYDATVKELDENLIGRDVIQMLQPRSVTYDMFSMSLSYLMFLKRKRCGKIKARGCADGRSQREYITKAESSSPTVKTQALMCSCLIDAIERRCVVVGDIPGAFLQADYPQEEGKECYLKFEGVMVDMICEIRPEYKRMIKHTKNGKRWLVGKVTKAIYGTLLGARLFYDKLRAFLESIGFEVNDYDECTFNSMIDGKQCTIQFHVDDLKISHVKQSVLDDVIDKLNNEFGTIKKLAASYGKVHEYLGMTIDYSEDGKVKLTMYDYLEDILDESPDDMGGTAVTVASDHLFNVNPECKKLNVETADYYHRTVARLLFASKRARPDLQTAVAYLCTRVASSDEDDYKKLKRVIQYIRDTIHLPLVLGWDESGILVWSIDASFAVHMDMRSHTGYCLTMGTGAVVSGSVKQKITTRSSTESELVGVDDTITFIEWISLFMKCQVKDYPEGDPLKMLGTKNLAKQDNTSTIKLANNGRRSCGQRTRHINIRYFYITDKIKDGTVVVTYCPTKEMISDYFTKPLQGSLFRQHRNAIMGVSQADYDRYLVEYREAKKAARDVAALNQSLT